MTAPRTFTRDEAATELSRMGWVYDATQVAWFHPDHDRPGRLAWVPDQTRFWLAHPRIGNEPTLPADTPILP